MSFVKIYDTILSSSINDASIEVRWLWIALLAMSNPDGVVHGTISAIARLANMPEDKTAAAMEELCSPDPSSSTPDEDGRRVEKLEGNVWHLINYEKYRARRDPDDERRLVRERVRRYRERKKAAAQDVQDKSNPVLESPQVSTVGAGNPKGEIRKRKKVVRPEYSLEFEMWWSEFKKGHPRGGGNKYDAFMAWQTTDHPGAEEMIKIWVKQRDGVFRDGFGVKDGQGYLNRDQWQQTGGVVEKAAPPVEGLPMFSNSREAADGGRGEEAGLADDDIPFA